MIGQESYQQASYNLLRIPGDICRDPNCECFPGNAVKCVGFSLAECFCGSRAAPQHFERAASQFPCRV